MSIGKWFSTKQGLWILMFGLISAVITTYQFDPDFWWSLRIGQLILFLHHVPQHLNYTFVSNTRPFIAQEWGSETLYALLWSWGHMLPILLLMGIVSLAGFIFIVLSTPYKDKTLSVFIGLSILLVMGLPTWGPRAQMFTFLGVMMLMWILRYRWSSKYWKLAIVLSFWIWGQLHGGFAFGLGVFALYLLGQSVSFWWQHKSMKGLGAWWLTFMFAALIPMFGPNGIGVYTYPLILLKDPLVEQYISEWLSPNFHDPRYWTIPLVLGIVLMGSLIGHKNKTYQGFGWNLGEMLAFGGALFWGLDANRNLILWGGMSTPIVIASLLAIFEFIKNSNPKLALKPPKEDILGRKNVFMWGVTSLMGIVLFLVLIIPNLTSPANNEFSTYYPVGVVNWVCSHPQIKRLWVPDGGSGWILSAIDPSGTPHGACSAVRVSFFGELVLMGKTGYADELNVLLPTSKEIVTLQKIKAQAVWMPTGSVEAKILSDSKKWKIAYRDQKNEIFVLKKMTS